MIEQNEILRRRDMREVFTFTIDPADAKDFDDAISFERLPVTGEGLPETYQIGVHIADVSFYVRPNTKVDDDAYKRGTSVYLVDRVLPMLPEELCNDKCSLRPNEDKLCMSVIFTMDADARVLKYKICRTVICSNARLNYDEAQEIIIKNSKLKIKNEELSDAITILHSLAQKLRTERIANGALTIEQEEMRFRLDEHGHPTEIYFEQPNEAHHLIEEFMLLANRTVAQAVGSGRPFVYRVHDLPNADKLDDLQAFKRKMGKRVSQQALDMLTIRAQAKAVYSTYNIGHYGLAFSHYTHFTSPIRRYPDLMVHRLVEKYRQASIQSWRERNAHPRRTGREMRTLFRVRAGSGTGGTRFHQTLPSHVDKRPHRRGSARTYLRRNGFRIVRPTRRIAMRRLDSYLQNRRRRGVLAV